MSYAKEKKIDDETEKEIDEFINKRNVDPKLETHSIVQEYVGNTYFCDIIVDYMKFPYYMPVKREDVQKYDYFYIGLTDYGKLMEKYDSYMQKLSKEIKQLFPETVKKNKQSQQNYRKSTFVPVRNLNTFGDYILTEKVQPSKNNRSYKKKPHKKKVNPKSFKYDSKDFPSLG